MLHYAEQHLAHFCQTYVACNRARNKTWPDAVRRLKKEIVRAQLMRYQAEKKLLMRARRGKACSSMAPTRPLVLTLLALLVQKNKC